MKHATTAYLPLQLFSQVNFIYLSEKSIFLPKNFNVARPSLNQGPEITLTCQKQFPDSF